jgi:predicted MFS family arabinose efflux permease
VPPTVALTRQAFGAANTGIVFGWIVAAHQVGAAVSASFAGFIRTESGSYDRAFAAAGALCLLSAVGVLFAGRSREPGQALLTEAA